MPFYIIGGLVVLYKYRWQGLWLLVCAALAVFVSDQTSNLIKHVVHRLRPCAVEQVRLLVTNCSNTYSFTSNHAANHFALAVLLVLAFRQHKWLIYVLIFWACFISFSQVYVGLHYPADVVGGAIIGVIAGYGVFAIFKSVKQKYFALSNI